MRAVTGLDGNLVEIVRLALSLERLDVPSAGKSVKGSCPTQWECRARARPRIAVVRVSNSRFLELIQGTAR
jgi:hypothetical protein